MLMRSVSSQTSRSIGGQSSAGILAALMRQYGLTDGHRHAPDDLRNRAMRTSSHSIRSTSSLPTRSPKMMASPGGLTSADPVGPHLERARREFWSIAKVHERGSPRLEKLVELDGDMGAAAWLCKAVRLALGPAIGPDGARESGEVLVGVAGFEPATPSSRTRCAVVWAIHIPRSFSSGIFREGYLREGGVRGGEHPEGGDNSTCPALSMKGGVRRKALGPS